MRLFNWLSILFLALLLFACSNTWLTIPSKNITVTGFDASAIGFGKPAFMHVFVCVLILVFLLIGKIWSKRVAFFISAFNIAWAIRNFISMAACLGGICPEKHFWFYMMLFCAFAITITILFGGVETNSSE